MNIWTLNNLLVRDLIPWTIETVDTIRVANYVKAAKLIYTTRAENNEMSGPHLTSPQPGWPRPWQMQSGCSHCPGSWHEDTLLWSPTEKILRPRYDIPLLELGRKLNSKLLLWTEFPNCVLGISLSGKSRNFFTDIKSWAWFTILELMHLDFLVHDVPKVALSSPILG